MMRVRYENSITFGAIVQAIILLSGLAAAWTDIRTRSDRQEQQIIRHEKQIDALTVTVQSIVQTQADIAKNLSVLTAIVNERTYQQLKNGARP